MSQAKSSKKPARKRIVDVEDADKTAPSTTSKPVIVTNRPILKDPMVNPEIDETTAPLLDESKLKHANGGPTIEPPDTLPAPDDESGSDTTDDRPDTEPDVDGQPADKPAEETAKKIKPEPGAEAAERAKHDAVIQKLVDSKRYELPINAVEKRKTKHFVALGILLSILLALAWVDIAADAGLVHVNGVKPVTHLFSN